jgi:hypothetical protein
VTHWLKAACLGAGMMALVGGAALAQTPTATTAPDSATAAADTSATVANNAAPAKEQGALDALAKMSAYLRSNPKFQVKVDTSRDEVDSEGHVVTFNGQTTYKVRAPNAFTISKVEGPKTRDYLYDGKSVTVYDPATKFYTHFDAPATIRQTLDLAADKYGVTVPLDDLFHWDQSQEYAAKLTSAHYVGDTMVNGQQTEQYVFSQPGVDWQIWIAKGDKPAPLRVVIIGNTDTARPRFEANLTWDTAPQFADDTFVFTPPADAKAIPIDAVAP